MTRILYTTEENCIRRKAFGSNPDTVTYYLYLLDKFTLPLQASVSLFAIERTK